ncbi:MAG: Gfo/Idh/MocA family protein, partial [Planctomycetota bacterium]
MSETIDRRKFLQSTATFGAGMVLNPAVFSQAVTSKADDINVALIGLGQQCSRLVDDAILKTKMYIKEGLRFKAVCDIWPYQLERRAGILRKAYKFDVNAYENYEEMLAKEKDLDAVIIATPDWLHAPMTIACLKAGLHVRSNPRYQAAEKLIREHKLVGRLLNINAQWNRSVDGHKVPLPVNKKIWVDESVLNRYAYGSMNELVNWRWYEKFGGGPLGDLGSHQIDIFNWFLGNVKPKSVMASAANDYYNYEHNENVMAIYDYETEQGSVRAFYQVLNTTCWGTYGQYYETFMGDIGSLLISEYATDKNNGWVFLEDYAKADQQVLKRWNHCIRTNLVGGEYELPEELKEKRILVLGGSQVLHSHPLLQRGGEFVHEAHLKNFFDA